MGSRQSLSLPLASTPVTPLLQTLGGLGLFLYGMAAMTSGLRKLAGDRLRHWLAASTRSPLSGAVTGAAVTAVIQSSSATTVTVIGFVSAGLMTFQQSLGLIFGANVGTTATAWLVALVGFKLQLSTAALPLLFLASLAYLFKANKGLRGFGKTLAGFSLIFLGISYLQDGLGGYGDQFDLSRWSGGSVSGKFALILIGAAIAMVTQSSSVAVAAALTGLNTGLIDLVQTASIIIGANIGTTSTALLATIGGSTAARRTGLAHLFYNVIAAVAALLILPGYLAAADRWFAGTTASSPESIAAMFHTAFNLLGLAIVLPFTRPFGRLIERLIPEKEEPLAAIFHRHLLDDPHTAISALESGCRKLTAVLMTEAARALGPGAHTPGFAKTTLDSLRSAVEAARDFAVEIGEHESDNADLDAGRIFACIHILDHIDRMLDRAHDSKRLQAARAMPGLAEKTTAIGQEFRLLADQFEKPATESTPSTVMETLAAELENDKSGFRHQAIQSAATRAMTAQQLDETLDAHRWLRRIAYHAARIAFYARSASPPSL